MEANIEKENKQTAIDKVVDVDGLVRCADCKHYKMHMDFAAYGICNNPLIYQGKIITNKQAEFFIEEDFGCVYFEQHI